MTLTAVAIVTLYIPQHITTMAKMLIAAIMTTTLYATLVALVPTASLTA
jgi:hypothetical protein